jgi:Zn-dependent protease
MLADVADVGEPLFWALFIGWVLSVVLHEFAHGLVALYGGDYTIRERGGLSLNPLQYADPIMSLALPLLFMLFGGMPLPGGATYVRRDLLRGRFWVSAVAAAGPAANFLIYLLLTLSLNPRVGWVAADESVADWTAAQRLVAALAFVQLLSVLLNLIPVPPLDGYMLISPYLGKKIQDRISQRPVAIGLFILVFYLIHKMPLNKTAYVAMKPITEMLGVSFYRLVTAARIVLYGHP